MLILDLTRGRSNWRVPLSLPSTPGEIAEAYSQLDGQRRTKLPLVDTPYERRG